MNVVIVFRTSLVFSLLLYLKLENTKSVLRNELKDFSILRLLFLTSDTTRRVDLLSSMILCVKPATCS